MAKATCTKCRACPQNQAVKIGPGSSHPRKLNDVSHGMTTFGRRQPRDLDPTPGPRNLNENPARRAFGNKKTCPLLASWINHLTSEQLIDQFPYESEGTALWHHVRDRWAWLYHRSLIHSENRTAWTQVQKKGFHMWGAPVE